MIVCVCRAVCDRELAEAIEAGAETPEQVERHCGAGGDCGTCRPDIQRMIDQITLRPPSPGLSLPVIQPCVRL